MVKSFVKEPWFIATLIGAILGALWLALCFFSVWLYRKRKSRKTLHKNGVITVPVHTTTDPNRVGHYFTDLQKDTSHPVEPVQPDLTNILDRKEDFKDNMYNTPHSTPHMKTFYNKQNSLPVAPYATTTLVTNNMLNKQGGSAGSAFRPINKQAERCGSSDSCMKHDMSSESNTDNSRPNTGYYFADSLPTGQCHGMDRLVSPLSLGSVTLDENGIPIKRPRKPPKPTPKQQHLPFNMADILPPPPEDPPPSEMGSPPGSPTHMGCGSPNSYQCNSSRTPCSPVTKGSINSLRISHGDRMPTPPRHLPLSDNESYRAHSPKKRALSPRTSHGTQSPQCGQTDNTSPRGQFVSPHSQSVDRPKAFSPRSVQDDRGPTPPVRGYRLIPLRENDSSSRCRSDNEHAPTPPMRRPSNCSQHAEDELEPLMDRGCQSSLPSLINEDHGADQRQHEYNPEFYLPLSLSDAFTDPEVIHRLQMCANGLGLDDPYGDARISPVSDLQDHEYADESDVEALQLRHACDSPDSSMGEVGEVDHGVSASMLASWASVTDNSNSSCSSGRSSASSSDGSFFTEADFASAVAKAAELSGLTVVGSTVSDPHAGEKNKRSRHRERAKRPTSPYSTDSNMSGAGPHKPYPKSQRKRQLLDQANKQQMLLNGHSDGDKRPKPPVRTKPPMPQHALQNGVGDIPSYNRPSFPSPSNNLNGSQPRPTSRSRIVTTPKTPPRPGDSPNIRANPLAFAFDNKDTPVV